MVLITDINRQSLTTAELTVNGADLSNDFITAGGYEAVTDVETSEGEKVPVYMVPITYDGNPENMQDDIQIMAEKYAAQTGDAFACMMTGATDAPDGGRIADLHVIAPPQKVGQSAASAATDAQDGPRAAVLQVNEEDYPCTIIPATLYICTVTVPEGALDDAGDATSPADAAGIDGGAITAAVEIGAQRVD